MQSCARIAFELAKEMDQLGVVVDADGLWLVQVSPDHWICSSGKGTRMGLICRMNPKSYKVGKVSLGSS